MDPLKTPPPQYTPMRRNVGTRTHPPHVVRRTNHRRLTQTDGKYVTTLHGHSRGIHSPSSHLAFPAIPQGDYDPFTSNTVQREGSSSSELEQITANFETNRVDSIFPNHSVSQAGFYDGASSPPLAGGPLVQSLSRPYSIERGTQLERLEQSCLTQETTVSQMLSRPIQTDYELLREIGNGQFGQILLCRFHETGEMIAVKRSTPFLPGTPGEEQAFSERHALTALRNSLPSSHVLQLLNGWIDDPNPSGRTQQYLVTPYYPNGTLAAMLRVRTVAETAAPWPEALVRSIAIHLVMALFVTHTAGIAHLDLKPDNVLISSEWQFLLADFGCAQVCSQTDVGSGTLLSKWPLKPPQRYISDLEGDKRYIAPDALNKTGEPGAADVFSLGITLIEVMMGQPAPSEPTEPHFEELRKGHLPSILSTQYSAPLLDVVASMIHPNPFSRPRVRDLLANPLCFTPESFEPSFNEPFDFSEFVQLAAQQTGVRTTASACLSLSKSTELNMESVWQRSFSSASTPNSPMSPNLRDDRVGLFVGSILSHPRVADGLLSMACAEAVVLRSMSDLREFAGGVWPM